MTVARFASYVLAFASSFVFCSTAFGQSTISGVVKDTTGAVIAGAKVDAASDVLIEKSRTVVTNGEGR